MCLISAGRVLADLVVSIMTVMIIMMMVMVMMMIGDDDNDDENVDSNKQRLASLGYPSSLTLAQGAHHGLWDVHRRSWRWWWWGGGGGWWWYWWWWYETIMMVTLRGNQGSNSMVKWSYGQVVQWPNGPMVPWHVILQNAPPPQCSYGVQRSIGARTQAVTNCGLSS